LPRRCESPLNHRWHANHARTTEIYSASTLDRLRLCGGAWKWIWWGTITGISNNPFGVTPRPNDAECYFTRIHQALLEGWRRSNEAHCTSHSICIVSISTLTASHWCTQRPVELLLHFQSGEGTDWVHSG
jgi:hypothetical protein